MTTIDSRAAADALAQGAVRARLAACAQVSGPIDSSYWWEGSVTTDQEWQVAFKTTATGYEALARHLAEEHPYDVPEILCFPVVAGHRPYLDWLDTEVTAPG